MLYSNNQNLIIFEVLYYYENIQTYERREKYKTYVSHFEHKGSKSNHYRCNITSGSYVWIDMKERKILLCNIKFK